MDELTEINHVKVIEIVDLNIEKKSSNFHENENSDLVTNNPESINGNKEETILLLIEHLVLLFCFALGIFIVTLIFNYLDFFSNKLRFYNVKEVVNSSGILTAIVTSILGFRVLINWAFFVILIFCKYIATKKQSNINNKKLLIERLLTWSSPLVTLPIIITSLTRLMVKCRYELSELGIDKDTLNAEKMLSNILIYYCIFLVLNLLIELPIVLRQYIGSIRISKRVGVLDYTMSYIGTASLVASILLYCFSYKYSDNTNSDPDLRSQVIYYYVTLFGVGVQSGIIAIIIGTLGYIASFLCSKILILISLVTKFYSVFVFSWSCSLILFGRHLLELFCNIDSISPNLNSFPLQDELAFKNACYTKPNFFLLSAFAIVQLILSILTLTYNFVFLLKIKSNSNPK